MATDYKSQSARDARDGRYGDSSYWNYLEQLAMGYREYYLLKGDAERAELMLTRSLSDALHRIEGGE